MPWDNILLGPKPRAPHILKALTQQDGDMFFTYQDKFNPDEQEDFLSFQRRTRAINEQLDGFEIVMVPIGDIQHEFEMLLEYTKAIAFPKLVNTRIISTLSSKQRLKYFPSKNLIVGGVSTLCYSADAIVDSLQRSHTSSKSNFKKEVLFAIINKPLYTTNDIILPEGLYYEESRIMIVSTFGSYGKKIDMLRLTAKCMYRNLFKMKPCYLYKCLMSPESVHDLKEEIMHLCPLCLRRIAIVLSSSKFNMTNFDYIDRYKKLGTCYQKHCSDNNGTKYITWINERCMSIDSNFDNCIKYDARPLPVYQQNSKNYLNTKSKVPVQRNVQGDENNSIVTVHKRISGFGHDMPQTVDKSKLTFLKRKIKRKGAKK